MFMSQVCARSLLPHVQPHNMRVMNAAPWGRKLVTSSLTTLTGRTSGRDILINPQIGNSQLFISLWDGDDIEYVPKIYVAAVYLERVMFALV